MHRTSNILSGKTITFDDVLDYYALHHKGTQGVTMSNYLKEYVKSRTDYFNNDFLNKDYLSLQELESDDVYSFNYPLISDMFKTC